MPQNIALQVRTPMPDLAAITRAAQGANLADIKMQNAPMQSELEALQMKDEIGERNAMGGYRDAVAKGDPNALDALASQPGLQKQMFEAFDGMSPKEFMEAKKRADRIANAAKFVGAIDPNDLGQNDRWAASAQVLLEEGVIDKSQFNFLIETGPNEFILQQAQTNKQWVDQYGSQKKKDDKDPEMRLLDIEEKNARIAQIKASTKTPEQKALEIKKLEAETEAAKAGNGKQSQTDRLREKQFGIEMEALGKAFATAIEAGGPDEIAAATAKFVADRQAIEKRYNMTDATAAPAGPTGAADPTVPTGAAPADIPTGAVNLLQHDPSLAEAFDEKYGEGAAASVLGGK